MTERAAWAHPNNTSHQKKWIEAMEYLHKHGSLAIIGLGVTTTPPEQHQPIKEHEPYVSSSHRDQRTDSS